MERHFVRYDIENITKVIGDNIRRIGLLRGLTQEQLANDADIDRSNSGCVENALDVDITDFFL